MRQDIRLTTLIHENMAVVMTFAFSREPLIALMSTHFHGEWKYLRKFVFEIPEERATRAAVELAAFFRLLDDDQKLAGYLKEVSPWRSFGTVFDQQGDRSDLLMREVANKIIHSANLEWDFSSPKNPKLVSYASQEQQPRYNWTRAEIRIVDFAAFCGELMS